MSISNSRRLLLLGSPSAAPQPDRGFGSFDMNVVMVLSVLLCALICSLCLNAILKVAFRCSTLLASMSWRHPKGVQRNVLNKFPTLEYSKSNVQIHGECVICLAEYEGGDRVRVLPKCYHAFHAHCIDKWLTSHTSCPNCRNSLADVFPKADPGSGSVVPVQGSSSSLGPPVVHAAIPPVQREGFMCNYRESSR